MKKSLQIATKVENCIQSLPESPTLKDVYDACRTFEINFYHIIGVAKLTHLLPTHEQYKFRNY